ncbi:MAG: SH3 domain-containing protein [Nocardioidaceae bacterium]|nr:SH3 domain-containing protein [Nocardioidaceae bacterium]
MTRIALPTLAAAVVTGSVVGVALGAGDGPGDVTTSAQVASGVVTGSTGSDDPAERRTDRPADRSADRSAGRLGDRKGKREAAERLEDRRQSISRAARRTTLVEKPQAVGKRFTTRAVNVRVGPGEDHRSLTVVEPAVKLPVTGKMRGEWAEVIYEGAAVWVARSYLAKKKPQAEEAAEGAPDESTHEHTDESTDESTRVTVGGVSTAPCAAGSSIESGITSAAVTVYRSVCAQFPSITSYGGWRGDGEHSDGRAIDVMASGALGWQVAEFLRANSSSLGLYDVIYSQRIWTSDRSAEGWRYMSDRGSTTANHYDHVHVKVY